MKKDVEALKEAGVPIEEQETPSQALMSVLKSLGYTFRLNLCAVAVEVNGAKIDDILAAYIRTQMRDRGVKNMAAMEDAYVAEARRNAYHPLKDYLNGLKWDGGAHIEALASKLSSDSGDVVYKDGARLPLHYVYLYKWLLGAAAKVLNGYQNPMLVWDGPQGLGKSLLARWLCPVPGYFIEGPINVMDKDSDVRLMSKFIWEVSELDATTRKADVSALKSFITKGEVTVRKAYGRHDVSGQALCSFIGTVNNSTGFLADETGSRRFYIVNLTRIDWSYRQLDVDQIWAEAVHRLTVDMETPDLTPEERAAQEAINAEYEVETPLEDWLRQYFHITGDDNDRLTMGDIINHLRLKDIKLSGPEKAQAGELARVLKRLGVVRATKRHNGKAAKVWVGIALNHGT